VCTSPAAHGHRKQHLEVALEHACVLAPAVKSTNISEGDNLRPSTSLARQMLSDARRGPAGTPEWPIGSPAELDLVIRNGLSSGGSRYTGSQHGLRGCWRTFH